MNCLDAEMAQPNVEEDVSAYTGFPLPVIDYDTEYFASGRRSNYVKAVAMQYDATLGGLEDQVNTPCSTLSAGSSVLNPNGRTTASATPSYYAITIYVRTGLSTTNSYNANVTAFLNAMNAAVGDSVASAALFPSLEPVVKCAYANTAAECASYVAESGYFNVTATTEPLSKIINGGEVAHPFYVDGPSPPPPVPPSAPPPSVPPSPSPPPNCYTHCFGNTEDSLVQGATTEHNVLCVQLRPNLPSHCSPKYGEECDYQQFECANPYGTISATGCSDKQGKWRRKKCKKKASKGKCYKEKIKKKCKMSCDLC